jgi:hypothetical protein
MREFDSGATRDDNEAKPNYEGFLSPLVLEEFGRYMHRHRYQADGEIRNGDNWQKGIPNEAYLDSLLRHVMDVWLHHRDYPEKATEDLKTALCAVLFNAQGYLFNTLLEEMKEWKAVPSPGWTCAICGTEDIESVFCPTCMNNTTLTENYHE